MDKYQVWFLISWFTVGFFGVFLFTIFINKNFLKSDILYSLLFSFLGYIICIFILFFHFDTIKDFLKNKKHSV